MDKTFVFYGLDKFTQVAFSRGETDITLYEQNNYTLFKV